MEPGQRNRLILDDPEEGPMNMALDQALLESTAVTGETTLRFYRWEPATLSLGYFQKYADRDLHMASRNCPVVRRASGGGAIIHDDELTYSLCVTSDGPIARANADLYNIVHTAIRSGLSEQGIEVDLYEAPPEAPVKASRSDPFLCFLRRAVGDIICRDAKVGGSAQRRLRNALIQHGSILLSGSTAAPELPGIKEQSGKEVDVVRLMAAISSKLASAMNLDFEESKASPAEIQRAKEILDQKFESESWTRRR